MKNTMRRPFLLIAMLAIVLALGFAASATFVSCSNGTTGGAGYYAGGGLSGTYYYSSSWYITLNGNGTFYARSSRTVSGTYSVQGSTLRLSSSFFGYNWTILNSNTLIDGDGDYWTKR